MLGDHQSDAIVRCPHGHRNPADHQFCGECGTRIDTSTSTPAEPGLPSPDHGSTRKSVGRWALVAAALVTATALVAALTYLLARDTSTVPATQATPTWPTPGQSPATRPQPPVPMPTQGPPPPSPARPTSAPPPAEPTGDLGLSVPISSPTCNGQGIVVLGNVTTPGQYAAGIQRLLDGHPGASYLRTDQSCPSLRQATETGNPIYAVYRLAGRSLAQVCAAVRAAGSGAYGRWLSTTVAPGHSITC